MLRCAAGIAVREFGERALLGDLLFRHADEAAPGRTGERAADADAAHAERRDVGDREPEVGRINRFTGLGATAFTTASICSRVRMPGA